MLLVGRLKVSYQELFVLTNSEINALVYGHEIDIKDTWNRDRTFAGLLVSPYAPKGYDIRRDFPFSWEEPDQYTFKATADEIAKAKKMWEIVDKYKEAKNGKSAD
jgi:hypothetical protein